MNYSLKDISVVIVTYNREKDLAIALNSFKNKIAKLGEVLIVDNSSNDNTERYIKSLKNPKIKYLKSRINSLTVSRNLGAKRAKGQIIVFLDDDVSLHEGYFEAILGIFNNNPKAKGVSGYYFPNIKINPVENGIRKMAFLENWTKDRAKVLSAFGASYPYKLTKIINSEWLSGFNMAYKKDLLEKNLFEEKFMKYALAEDFEFSTRINKKYPGSLFITPHAKLIHRVSEAGRTPKPKLIYMNLVNHLYIQSKNLNSFKGIVYSYIALFNFSLLQVSRFLAKPDKSNAIRLKTYFKALNYCIRRLGKIRKGIVDIPSNL